MITKVSIRNFKCLRDVQIGLERFTVFVGPNASGKSSILQGLELLCRSFREAPELNLDGVLTQAISRKPRRGDHVELAVESGNGAYRYRTRPLSPRKANHILSFSVVPPGQAWTGAGRGIASDLHSVDWKPWAPSQGNEWPLPLPVLLRLEASKLKESIPTHVTGLATPDLTRSWRGTELGFIPNWRTWHSMTRIPGSSCRPTSGESSPRFASTPTYKEQDRSNLPPPLVRHGRVLTRYSPMINPR